MRKVGQKLKVFNGSNRRNIVFALNSRNALKVLKCRLQDMFLKWILMKPSTPSSDFVFKEKHQIANHFCFHLPSNSVPAPRLKFILYLTSHVETGAQHVPVLQ